MLLICIWMYGCMYICMYVCGDNTFINIQRSLGAIAVTVIHIYMYNKTKTKQIIISVVKRIWRNSVRNKFENHWNPNIYHLLVLISKELGVFFSNGYPKHTNIPTTQNIQTGAMMYPSYYMLNPNRSQVDPGFHPTHYRWRIQVGLIFPNHIVLSTPHTPFWQRLR